MGSAFLRTTAGAPAGLDVSRHDSKVRRGRAARRLLGDVVDLDDAAVESRHDLAEHDIVEVRGLPMGGERLAGGVALEQDDLAVIADLAVGGEGQVARLLPDSLDEGGQQGQDFVLLAGGDRVAGDYLQFGHRLPSRVGGSVDGIPCGSRRSNRAWWRPGAHPATRTGMGTT